MDSFLRGQHRLHQVGDGLGVFILPLAQGADDAPAALDGVILVQFPLALDPLHLRRLVPRRARQRLYDRRLTRSRAAAPPGAAEIRPDDFRLAAEPLAAALDLVAVCDLD